MPLLWLSLSYLAGNLIAASLRLSVLTWMALSGGPLAVWLGGRFWFTSLDRKFNVVPLPLPLLLVVAALGAARYTQSLPDLADPGMLSRHNDQSKPMIVEGVLVEPPDVRDTYTNLTLQVERVQVVGEDLVLPAHGQLLAKVAFQGDWQYGDRLRLGGYLVSPPETEDFSYRDYLYRQQIYSMMEWPQVELLQRGAGRPFWAALFAFKGRALATVYRLYPDPEASLLAGIVLGVETGIPPDVTRAFRDTGTAHIIAISGFNVAILAGLFVQIFGYLLGRWRGALAAAIGIAAYTLLVGASPSVVRAALMGGIALLARQVGRQQDGLNSLAFVAALMCMLDPLVPWDVGFQLSFAATLGLVLYGSPSQRALASMAGRVLPPATATRLAELGGEYFLFTLAAQVTALPVTLYHFQRLSLSSLIANPLVLPVQPAVMVLGGVGALVGMFFLPLGQAIAYLAWPFVVYTIRMVEWLSKIPGGVIALGQTSLVWIGLFYIALFGLTIALRTSPTQRLQQWVGAIRPSLVLFGLLVVNVLVWRAVLAAPDGRLHVTLLDTNTASLSGEAVLIQSPEGRYVLIGGGPSASALSEALGRRLPLNHRGLDALIVANPADEQVAALPRIVERFPPSQVLWAGAPQASRQALFLQTALSEAGIVPIYAESGQSLDLGQGAVLRVVDTDGRGATLVLEWRSFRLLLPLGMDAQALKRIQRESGLAPVTAFLLADSGDVALNPPEWIERLIPQVVLLSVAPGDRKGLPSPETLEAVEGYTLLRTDRNGWIELTTDGQRMWVEVERK